MTDVISIKDYTLAGMNFALKNVSDNKDDFEANLEMWLKNIDEAGGNLSDEDKKIFGDQEQALHFVKLEDMSGQDDIEKELKTLCGLIVPLNTLNDWSSSNLKALEEGEKEADPEDKELYSNVIRVIQDFAKEVITLSNEVSEITEQLKRSKELMAVI